MEKYLYRKERNRRLAEKWNRENPEKAKEKSKRYYAENKSALLEKNNKWRKEFPDKVREIKKRAYIRNKSNPIETLKKNLRNGLRKAFRGIQGRKNGKAIEALGCSIEFFRSYIEARFSSGMSWWNYGPSTKEKINWQLDHIVPIGSSATESDVLRLSHFTNFQPKWDADNNAKSDIMPCGLRARDLKKPQPSAPAPVA